MPGVEIFETLSNDKRSLIYVLQVDFSVPKLLYGNSLQEVVEADKELIFSRLKSSLARVGVMVEIERIAEARVSAVHFCKNIFLPSTMKMRGALKELERVDAGKVVDVTSKMHKNGGRVVSVYSGTLDHVFYDKISDSVRPKNKRQDKSPVDRERAIVERFGLESREVFRYEYRIKKTQTVMRDVSKALGRSYGDICFNDLFVSGLFKKVLLSSWRKLITRPENRLALFAPIDGLTLLLHMVSEAEKSGLNPHTLNKVFISYGIARAVSDHGAKEVRGIMSGSWCKRHPNRITEKIKTAAGLVKTIPYSNNIAFIDKALEDFIRVDMQTLQNESHA